MWHKVLLYLVISLGLGGCCFIECGTPPQQPNINQLPDPMLFGNPQCNLPCWHGMTPGTSTKYDVESFFSTVIVTPYWNGFMDGYFWYEHGSSNRKDHYYTAAYVHDDRLTMIWLEGPFKLSLKNIISQVGIPPYVSTQVGSFGPTMTQQIQLTLFYPGNGLALSTTFWDEYPTKTEARYCVKEDNPIYSINIVKAGNISNIIDDRLYARRSHRLSDSELDALVQRLRLWSGYGCFSVKYNE